MLRLLKRWFGPFLPRWAVNLIKRRIEANFNRGPVSDFNVEPVGTTLRCTIDHQWSFLAPQECLDDLSERQSSRELRAEISGLTNIALLGGILFDIGAHVGVVSSLFCTVRPTNRVYSFEPSPVAQKQLEKIRALNQFEARMFIQSTAIGRDHSKLEMLLDPIGGQVQVQHFEHTIWGTPQRIEVDVESISQAAERLGIIPDFIKLDIEGYEYEAVQGAMVFLSTHRPVLLFELHHNYLEERKLSPGHVITMLTDCGYVFSTYAGEPLSAKAIADTPLQSLRFLARAPKT